MKAMAFTVLHLPRLCVVVGLALTGFTLMALARGLRATAIACRQAGLLLIADLSPGGQAPGGQET